MTRFYQNLLGKRPGLESTMPKAAALADAKRWLRELSAEQAQKLAASATDGVDRGDRGKGETLKLSVRTDREQSRVKEFRPYEHPRYWSAFILVGDPN